MKTVEQLEAELDAARVRRYEQEVATEAAQRINIALAGIEGYLIHLPEGIAAEFAALVAKAKSLSEG
ncbi:hypothetical protein [Noviherbaspirillum suwonense]|uniref:Uncharacterized protein n=1 Tax=Noviherbaspirillum suwonense TaxID=1224511 RepID=A0ABY1QLD0_9BURK|nr:hypothetical protein [Noviherbaspirillum suwonense]SMP71930.1 hypothetical protein SAMN06295970_11793 [Noviherbaspirillum suwonense]